MILPSVVRSGRMPKRSWAPPRADAERDHLVEDQQDAEALGDLAQPLEEALARGGSMPALAMHRIDDERGDVAPLLLEDLLAGLGVVPRQHHHVLEHRAAARPPTTPPTSGRLREPAVAGSGDTLTSTQSWVPW